MNLTADTAAFDDIRPWRDLYRQEMNCQIIHDSLHRREGWTQSFQLRIGGTAVGYGAVAVAGPWKDKPTMFEFFVAPPYRAQAFKLFHAFQSACGATRMEVQSNDPLITVMLHVFARGIETESILFHDELTTSLAPAGASIRPAAPDDGEHLRSLALDESAKWIATVDGELAGAGDILYHYNRPYGDIYMKVAESFRRQGIGAFLVQELKRVCYEGGSIPGARCNPKNVASRMTLQKAGFVPHAHLLTGVIPPDAKANS